MPHKDPRKKQEYMQKRYVKKAEEIKTYQKNYRKEHSEAIKVKRRPYQRDRYLKRRVVRKLAFIKLAGGVCQRCAETHPGILDFHHIDPETKLFNIGKALNVDGNLKITDADILQEIQKCELLCRNCHGKHHISWTEVELEMMEQLAKDYFAEED